MLHELVDSSMENCSTVASELYSLLYNLPINLRVSSGLQYQSTVKVRLSQLPAARKRPVDSFLKNRRYLSAGYGFHDLY
jgi:hypothetical protein